MFCTGGSSRAVWGFQTHSDAKTIPSRSGNEGLKCNLDVVFVPDALSTRVIARRTGN